MKKIILVAITAIFMVIPDASAQSGISGLFGKLFGGKSSTQTTENSTVNSITNVLGTLLGNSVTLSEKVFKGTWNYAGTACILESDAALANIGGTVVTTKIEEKLDGYLAKVGVKEGTCKFTFEDNNVCRFQIAGKEITGTYTLNAEEKSVNFVFYNALSMTAHVAYNITSMDIVFNSDKMLALIQNVLGTVAEKGAAMSSQSNGTSSLSTATSTITTINSLLKNYKGMMLGMKLTK